jgi:hypothetical protein
VALTIFENKRAVRKTLAELVTSLSLEDNLRGIAYALMGDTGRYYNLALQLGDEDMKEVGLAASASNRQNLLRIALKLIAERKWRILSELTLLLQDVSTKKWIVKIMYDYSEMMDAGSKMMNEDNLGYFGSFPSIAVGDGKMICMADYDIDIKTTSKGPLVVLKELEAYYKGKDPNNPGAEPIVTVEQQLLLAAAALMIAPD